MAHAWGHSWGTSWGTSWSAKCSWGTSWGDSWLETWCGTGGGSFPAQFLGLRFFNGTVQNLCLVAKTDAPTGMGGVAEIDKNGTTYAVYLVETTDPNASSVRIKTSTGIKAIRLKT